MDRLNFSTNWNRKLDCNVFSTIRRFNAKVHFVGKEVEVYDNSTKPGRYKGRAKYVIVEPFKLHQLKPAAAMLDTGYSLEETKNIIYTMYKNTVENIDQETFCYCILEKIKEKPQQQAMFK